MQCAIGKLKKYTIAMQTAKNKQNPKDFIFFNWNTGKWKSSNVNGRTGFILEKWPHYQTQSIEIVQFLSKVQTLIPEAKKTQKQKQ